MKELTDIWRGLYPFCFIVIAQYSFKILYNCTNCFFWLQRRIRKGQKLITTPLPIWDAWKKIKAASKDKRLKQQYFYERWAQSRAFKLCYLIQNQSQHFRYWNKQNIHWQRPDVWLPDVWWTPSDISTLKSLTASLTHAFISRRCSALWILWYSCTEPYRHMARWILQGFQIWGKYWTAVVDSCRRRSCFILCHIKDSKSYLCCHRKCRGNQNKEFW